MGTKPREMIRNTPSQRTRLPRFSLLLAATAAALTLASCSTMTPQRKAALEEEVQRCLEERDYTVRINYMMPLRGGSRALGGDYSIQVKDGMLHSYLPYLGVATSARYGGGNPLSFEKRYTSYDERVNAGRNPSREAYIIVTTDEDTFLYHLKVFPNGKADLKVTGRNRDAISFLGELSLPDGG